MHAHTSALRWALYIMRSGPTPKSHVPMIKLCKFYLRLLHPMAIARKAPEHFFFIDVQAGAFLAIAIG